ncbi:MAG TPA: sulfite exporter TauE/SafE family protein [Rhodobacteraceae bacterium]|nr:sulfite exporter TauE/SafE family protein [Paracoccaceae bacterium]
MWPRGLWLSSRYARHERASGTLVDPLAYFYIGLAAFLVGFTKTSVGGVGILAVLLMALAIPGSSSPGVLLPMLIAADIMAVIYYRRACQWRILARLIPPAILGVALAWWFLSVTSGYDFNQLIGWVILAMLALDILISDGLRALVQGKLLTGVIGTMAGAASMVANAAGPIFGIYLLQMGLSKSEFIGTRSWFFLLVNIVKLPFAIGLGITTSQSLSLNLYYLPVILLGAILGKQLISYINLGLFKILIRAAVLAAAARLILG